MKIIAKEKNFYRVEDIPMDIQSLIKFKIPVKYRVFTDTWNIQKKYIPLIIAWAKNSGIAVDTSAAPEYPQEEDKDAHTVLFLTPDAPEFVVAAVWKALAKHYHPDVSTGNEELFLKYKKAFDSLKGA